MGLKVNELRIPGTEAGFDFNRNFELTPDTALIDPSVNFNLHNMGIEKRGGSSILFTPSVTNRVMGGYDFRQTTGNQFQIYAKNNGSVYFNSDSNVIATGMAVSNFFHFSQLADTLYIADGSTTPKMWTGSGSATNVTPASDWAIKGNPFQIIFHPSGANFRNWAITKYAVYASKNNNGSDFADADVTVIPVYSVGGLVAAWEFGQRLFVASKTETFIIDDTNVDPTLWGYEKAIWEGGAAHWRLVTQADNDIYIMAEDLTIYSLNGVFQTGNYRRASLTRPAQIDRYLRENSTFGNIENWHCAYDKKLRCVKWFIQISGSNTNTALVQFIDREPHKIWAIHNNNVYASGYSASYSWSYRKGPSDFRVRTGDYNGNIWELEGSQRNDSNNPYLSVIKWKRWEFNNPLMHKFFPKGILRIRSATNITLTIFISINNIALPMISTTITASGATFDNATFDNSVFAGDLLADSPFDVKSYGKVLQMEIDHNGLNEDFFLSEVIIAYKEQGVRIAA
jgi:hypothetical protein